MAKDKKKKSKPDKQSVYARKGKPLFARRIEQGYLPAGRGKFPD